MCVRVCVCVIFAYFDHRIFAQDMSQKYLTTRLFSVQITQERAIWHRDINRYGDTLRLYRYQVPGYYKRNRHFQCCIETKLLMI